MLFSCLFTGHTSASDVDLLYCLDMALQKNSEIKKARAEFLALKELEDQSFANLLPSVGLSVSRSKVNQERSDGTGLSLEQNYIMESDAISVRQPVYRPNSRDLKKLRKKFLQKNCCCPTKKIH